MVELLGVGFHEFDANWVWEYQTDTGEYAAGLTPYYAVERKVREHDGVHRTTTEFDGDEYFVRLNYEDSGIGALNHPSCEMDTIREYRITWQRDDDAGQCSGSFHIAPRAPDMEDESGDRIRVPDLVGLNVRAQGSNLQFEDYLPLFRQCTRALGLSRRYWLDEYLHTDDYSNIQDGEVYVRLEDGCGGQFIAVDGVLTRIANLSAGDRSGYTKHIRDDRDRAGYYHTATIGDGRASELIDMHSFAKEVKYYYARHSDSFADDHPLSHPKLGVSLQSSISDGTLYWGDLDRFVRELEETLLNVLNWEDFPTSADELDGASGPYINFDPYFDPEPFHRNRRLLPDPTPELKETQSNIVIRHLRNGFEDSDVDVLTQLVADGGEHTPKEIAKETGWHYETVLRRLKQLDDLVEHRYNDVQLHSHHVAKKVTVALQEIRDAGRDALDSLAQEIRESTTKEIVHDALLAWFDEHGVDVDDRQDAQMKLRMDRAFDSLDEATVALLHGLHAWEKAGWPRRDFLQARVRFEIDGYAHRRLVDNVVHR